ncbi:MAG: host attachment protein [Deltaproteobacteria bacterium]|nr:host attachment protein [Deltaproteobacteria bacterium]
MSQTWIIVADGSHARLFQTAGASQPWRLVQKLDREHSREKTDRAESHEDRGEHDFARLVAAELETKRQGGGFERLVLVATPKFLGQLRGELAAPLASCVVRSHDADYTDLSDAELAKRVDVS